ncbi:endoplasmic reticulum resident protein 44 isoform X1 [Bemisia tabaci]|uniref:endoplasmic reticulum resident protein 44 isoform X1 n=1 Tax=Bemisia tabaci TaxID=7038 RepID=UPI003B282D80
MDTFYPKKLPRINLLGHLFLCFLFYNPTDSGAVQLTQDNIDNILEKMQDIQRDVIQGDVIQAVHGDGFQAAEAEVVQAVQGDAFQAAQAEVVQAVQGDGFQAAQAEVVQAVQGDGYFAVQGEGFQAAQGENGSMDFHESSFFEQKQVGGAVHLTKENIDNILATNELVLINFYADWCRFSNLLQPIWDEAAEKISAEFPTPGRVLVGKVDCDKENTVAERYHITKYPTLKVIRNGSPAKREYRGQRSAEAFLTFVKSQLENPIKEFFSLQEMNNFDTKKRIIIGFFDTKDVPEYDIFRRVATNLKEDCLFYVGVGEPVRTMHPPGTPIIAFRPDHATPDSENESYKGSLSNYDELNAWMTDKCVPLVREITFENAEELTEEGLPFLILFHKPDDLQTVKLFKEIVVNELISEKQNVNFLTADGEKFAHPLHHLGKSQSDLPLIAIDSFRHMYMFPDTSQMTIPGKLKTFIQDLYSGKLHREYHYGPDPPTEILQIDGKSGPTTPPESTFKKLAPSDKRYTLLLKDEL